MINFRQKGTDIIIDVKTGTDIPKSLWHFYFNVKYEAAASIVVNYLNQRLWNLVRTARQNAYEKGYQAGRNHTKRQTYFDGNL